MTDTENHPDENDYEDGDHDQFDLGTSFDDLESGYFENQTHLPADIQAKYEEENNEKYEEEYGSDEDLHGDPADSLETETDSEWSDAIEALKSRKGKLDRLTKERKIALDEFNEARYQLFPAVGFKQYRHLHDQRLHCAKNNSKRSSKLQRCNVRTMWRRNGSISLLFR